MRIGVVAHETRRKAVRALLRAVDADVCDVDKVTPRNPADGAYRCAVNHLYTLEKLLRFPDDDWYVILEDDAQPVANFRSQLERALAAAPAPLVGLYLGTGNPSGEVQRQIGSAVVMAQTYDKAWITGDFFISAVGYALTGAAATDLVNSVDVHRERTDMEWPMRVTRWQQRRGILTAYTHPSLVDHADDESVILPALRGHRKAWTVGEREDWESRNAREPVIMGYSPGWSPRR